MSQESNQALYEKMKSSTTEEAMLEYRNQLIVANLPLVKKFISAEYKEKPPQVREELEGALLLCLVERIQLWKGRANLSSYLWPYFFATARQVLRNIGPIEIPERAFRKGIDLILVPLSEE